MLPIGEMFYTAWGILKMTSVIAKRNGSSTTVAVATATATARGIVEDRYREAVSERESAADKIFYDGEDLQQLDPSMSQVEAFPPSIV